MGRKYFDISKKGGGGAYANAPSHITQIFLKTWKHV